VHTHRAIQAWRINVKYHITNIYSSEIRVEQLQLEIKEAYSVRIFQCAIVSVVGLQVHVFLNN
jgi:hypothetical protein